MNTFANYCHFNKNSILLYNYLLCGHLFYHFQNPETGKYEFRYIFVDIDTYPRRTIIVEDNR